MAPEVSEKKKLEGGVSEPLKSIHKKLKRKELKYLQKDSPKKIISIEDPLPSLVVIGNRGNVGVLEPETLEERAMYDVDLECKDHKATLSSRHNHVRHRVTDVVSMKGCDFFVIATTKNCLHFIDTSDYTHLEGYRLHDMPAIVTSLYFSSDSNSEHLLFFGDAKGNVGYIRFLQPLVGLFEGKRFAGVEVISFKTLSTSHTRYAEHKKLSEKHGKPVRDLWHSPKTGTVISCSYDTQSSVIIQHVAAELQPQHVSVYKGVSSFVFNPVEDLLLTNSRKCEILVWASGRKKRRLLGHEAPVSSILLAQQFTLLFTIDSDLVVFMWSASSLTCLRQARLNFAKPSSPLADRCQSFLFCALGSIYAARGKYIVKLGRELCQSTDVNSISDQNSSNEPECVLVKDMVCPQRGWLLTTAEERALMVRNCVCKNMPFSALQIYHLDHQGALPKAEEYYFTVCHSRVDLN